VQLHRLCAGVALHRRRRVGVAQHQDVLAACAATGECAPARPPRGASAPQRAPRLHRQAPEGRGAHRGWGPGKSRAGADTPRSPLRAPARSGCHQSAMAAAPPQSAACCPARATCCAGWSLRKHPAPCLNPSCLHPAQKMLTDEGPAPADDSGKRRLRNTGRQWGRTGAADPQIFCEDAPPGGQRRVVPGQLRAAARLHASPSSHSVRAGPGVL